MNYYSDGVYAVEGIHCKGIVHTIRKGDTLYKISRIYGVTVEQLMDANEDMNVYNLEIGSKICVPISDRPRPTRGIPYTVRAEDDLNSILKLFDMTFDTFARYNPQLMPIPLEENSVIFIPPDKILRDVDND